MELPHLGQQCSEKSCHKLDFLPITCDACKYIFCNEHFSYANHNCPNAYMKNNQVPVCPLCNVPIPIARGQQPDRMVGEHIDNDCQSDPAKSRRKVYTNRCMKKGCKNKEFMPVVCNECKQNFCLKHRHAQDHSCGKRNTPENKSLQAALQRQNNLNDDEQLARAIALSMQEGSNKALLSQEELDLQLAKQLQAMETVGAGNSSSTRGNQRNGASQRCDLQ